MKSAFTHRIEVRFRDCDALGHVNNAVYFTYFEQARLVMGERLGFRRALDYLGLILVHAACDYKAQVVFGEELEVTVGIVALGRTSFTCEFEVRKVDDGTLVSTGRSVQAVFDYEAERTTPMPPSFRAILQRLIGQDQAASES